MTRKESLPKTESSLSLTPVGNATRSCRARRPTPFGWPKWWKWSGGSCWFRFWQWQIKIRSVWSILETRDILIKHNICRITYTLPHRECGPLRTCLHDCFEKFEMISTPTGSWWGLRRDRIQLPVGRRNQLEFFKTVMQTGDGTVHTLDGTEYRISSWTINGGGHLGRYLKTIK